MLRVRKRSLCGANDLAEHGLLDLYEYTTKVIAPLMGNKHVNTGVCMFARASASCLAHTRIADVWPRAGSGAGAARVSFVAEREDPRPQASGSAVDRVGFQYTLCYSSVWYEDKHVHYGTLAA